MPFHRNLAFLKKCLDGIGPLPAHWELIIAGDAPVDDCGPLAAAAGARLLTLPGPNGPGVARNRAADVALGRILVFIDADVVTSPEALERVATVFRTQPDTAAVFGAYDEFPGDPGFISQYKNLAHSFIHQSAHTIAQTFWAGFGAVRRDAFLAVGGFDERFARPSVEDIDLGYRLTAAGFRVVLDASIRACHLKRWTLGGMILSDIRDRGIPWTQLILRFGRFNSDLNLKSSYRACVVLSYVMLALIGLAIVVDLRFGLLVPPLVAALILLSPRYYRFFLQRRGVWFVLRVFPVHYLYHLYNGFSFAVGTTLFTLQKRAGIRLPWALPLESWDSVRPRPQAGTLPGPRAATPAVVGSTRRSRPGHDAVA